MKKKIFRVFHPSPRSNGEANEFTETEKVDEVYKFTRSTRLFNLTRLTNLTKFTQLVRITTFPRFTCMCMWIGLKIVEKVVKMDKVK